MIFFPKNEYLLSKEKIASIIETLPKMLHKRVLHAYIFGSVAKGNFNAQSDIDILLIIKETTIPFFKRGFEFQDVLDLFTPMDLIIYTEKEFYNKIESSPQIGFWGEFIKNNIKLI